MNKGIIVDEHLRTSSPEVYAAGDVAEFDRGEGLRDHPRGGGAGKGRGVEHPWGGGSLSGHGPLQHPEGERARPFLRRGGESQTSAQGEGQGYKEVRLVDDARGIYKKLVFKEGRLVGAILPGAEKSALQLSRLIASRQVLSGYEEALLSEEFDFKGL
ncbi:TPA: hypothetical protein EYP12_00015 [Candidatus Bipolaricaulota bacterium]|nr:hypothetical protein [Candidatus Bipolaricaulota bacterium]